VRTTGTKTEAEAADVALDGGLRITASTWRSIVRRRRREGLFRTLTPHMVGHELGVMHAGGTAAASCNQNIASVPRPTAPRCPLASLGMG